MIINILHLVIVEIIKLQLFKNLAKLTKNNQKIKVIINLFYNLQLNTIFGYFL